MSRRVNLLEGNITASLTRLAFPIMGMSLLQMAYNLTDMFWIGKLGAGAVASVGTGGLLMWLSMGVHMLAQLGGQVFVGQNLGAQKNELAGKYAHASIFMSAFISICLGCVFFFLVQPIVSIFNLNDPQVIIDAQKYVGITGGFIFFSLMSKMLTALITTSGDSKTPFYATTVGLVFNIIFDPILIFGYLGFPPMGVQGAALATVLAQAIVFILLATQAIKDKHLFSHVHLFTLPELSICKKILVLSIPAALQNTLMPLISIYVSRMIAGFGDNAVAAQRIGSQVESLSWMAAEGFSVAVNSFIAQNFGAQNIARAKEGYFKAIKIIFIYSLFSSSVLIFGAGPIFSIFLSEAEVLAIGTEYLFILGLSQTCMCIEILTGAALNGFGQSKLPAAIVTLFTFLRIPGAMILSASVLGLSGIWWTITLSSVLKGIILFVAMLWFLKKLTHKTQTI